MKKFLILYKLLFLGLGGYGQLSIGTGAQWISNGNTTVVLQNMDLVNNGSISAGSGSFKFTGSQNSTISGTSMPLFSIIEISKTTNAKVLLGRNISIGSSLNFISGQLDLNGSNIMMSSSAMIAGESENNRIIGPNGGFIEITQNMNAPASVNAGNLGATITSSNNLGSVIIRRGHVPQSGIGLPGSINRYFLVIPTNNSNLNATLRFRYFDAELNGQSEAALAIYQSSNSGTDWNNLSQTTRNANANYVEKTAIANLSLQTLANDAIVAVDGVTGLVFTGQRKKTTEVTLKWTTQTETNMSGYQVQRRLKNEVDFSDRAFVSTLAPGGNSLSQLSYQNVDANSYNDTSYYRLKLLTTGNTFTYSNEIAITAKTNGGGGNGGGNPHGKTAADSITTTASVKMMTKTNAMNQKITVGPNPNNGNFWFSVSGIEKETVATLYTMDGKQLKQFRISNLQQQQVSGLSSGIYLLKVPRMEAFKITVQGGSNSLPNNIITDPINIKN